MNSGMLEFIFVGIISQRPKQRLGIENRGATMNRNTRENEDMQLYLVRFTRSENGAEGANESSQKA